MGLLDTEEFEKLRSIFTRFDMDSDGSLTHLELAALLRCLGLKLSGDQTHQLLRKMDSNRNGLVEFNEFVEAIAPDMNDTVLINEEELMEIFRLFDRDGNGVITIPELARSMARMGKPLTFVELTEMMREADTDGDGVICFTEFSAVMAKFAAHFRGLTVSS